MLSMDFRRVWAFIAVAEELSVVRAAERLHISQPPLTRRIRQLEEELGLTLFVRNPRGMKLTDAGQLLLSKARVVATAASDLRETARKTAPDCPNGIRIGIGRGLWEPANMIRLEFAKRFARVAIEATDILSHRQQNDQLEGYSQDILLGRPPFDETRLNVVRIFQQPVVAILSQGHPLATRQTVRLSDLADDSLLLWDRHMEPVLYDKILALYANAGVAPRMVPTPEAGPYNCRGLMSVASRKGIYLFAGLAPGATIGLAGIAVVPVKEPDATADVCVAWRIGETSPTILQFLESVWQVFPEGRFVSPMTRAVEDRDTSSNSVRPAMSHVGPKPSPRRSIAVLRK